MTDSAGPGGAVPDATVKVINSENAGHGHVRPRPDGVTARCGGPGICATCSREAARVGPRTPERPAERIPAYAPALSSEPQPDPDRDCVYVDVRDGRLTVTQTTGRALHLAVNGEWVTAPDRERTTVALDAPVKSLAEIEADRLGVEVDEYEQLNVRLADLLTRTADALKGAPGDLQLHGWHDLPEIAAAVVREREQLRYERILLGQARVVLDATAETVAKPSLRNMAATVAQRIVDEIGHPVTDEAAVGPGLRDLAVTAWELISHANAPDYGGTEWIRTAAGWAEQYQRLTGQRIMPGEQDDQSRPVGGRQVVQPEPIWHPV